jgi:hypothetical protein
MEVLLLVVQVGYTRLMPALVALLGSGRAGCILGV